MSIAPEHDWSRLLRPEQQSGPNTARPHFIQEPGKRAACLANLRVARNTGRHGHVPATPGTPPQSLGSPQVVVRAIPMPAWKRGLDLTLTLLSLVILGPVMAVLSAAIWCVSPGPVLFRQERIGHGGRPFTCFKLRSMRLHAEQQSHKEHLEQLMASNTPMTKMDAEKDTRLIPLGALLRASGLDELPQLFNVLRGDMSLVGPRPCIRYEYDQYTAEQKDRLLAVPGITGLWQVNGKNRTTFEEMVALDIRYAHTQSLRLDLSILLRTPATVAVQLFDLIRQLNRETSQTQATHNEGVQS